MGSKIENIVLIGNYIPDKQQSMHRFLSMLELNFKSQGLKVDVILPTVFLGKFSKNTNTGLGKYFGYFDKYLLFPLVLLLKKRKYNNSHSVFHICDHSNAIYISYLPQNRTIVTCHDVLAIRGAKGFKDAYCDASSMGMILQNWILKSLQKTKKIAFVSQTTALQFDELCSEQKYNGHSELVYNSLNGNFYPMEINHALNALNNYPQLQTEPFILHVGSGLPRKNRKLLIEMLVILGPRWKGNVCFVGEELDQDSLKLINENQLSNRVVVISSANHQILLSLYRLCSAFVFPSFSEGFGWPVIEAQACSAPVITSNIQPMPEIAGKDALCANPHHPEEFAEAFLYLQDLKNRNLNIEQGLLNSKRFEMSSMINAYLNLYNA